MKKTIYILGVIVNVIYLPCGYGHFQYNEFIYNHQLILLLGYPIGLITSIIVWITNFVVWYKHKDRLVYLLLNLLLCYFMNPIYAVRILRKKWLWN